MSCRPTGHANKTATNPLPIGTTVIFDTTRPHRPAVPARRAYLAASRLATALSVCLGLVAASCHATAADIGESTQPPSAPAGGHELKRADFKREHASEDVKQLAAWVLDSGNNHAVSFMIVDKKEAKLFVFDPDGQLRGASAALLGAAAGDDSVPGIGSRALSTIRPEERTTPAGRFVAALDHNISGKDILWVDYANAISLHRVVTSNANERRAQRLATPTPDDNRISYGCINVPAKFFDKVVIPAFKKTHGIVYILPETRPIGAVFRSFNARQELPQSARRAQPEAVLN
jgi:hypothetical protein